MSITLFNPATGAVRGTIEPDGLQVVTEKAAWASQGQRDWARTPYVARAAAIERFRDLVAARVDALAEVLTADTGKPITQARNEIRATPGRIQWFLDETEALLAPQTLATEGTAEELSFDPLGRVANISAWNYPWFVGTNVFVPALLTGNAVLYKPSEHAIGTGRAIAELLHEAGVPEAAFVPIIGGGAAGAALVDQPIDGVFFTGSWATGQRVAAQAGKRLLTVQLELGGKDPAYVTDDVDVAAAAAGLADGAFYNAGQSCCAVERIYVHATVYDAFVDAFLEVVAGFRLGDPLDPETYLGPLAREAQIAVLEGQIADAVERGATIRAGGRRADRAGWYFEPTVLTAVHRSMQVMRDETFGPLIGVQRVEDDAEAIELMNDTEYGLTAAVYGRDQDRARAILQQVDTGTSYWNCCDRVSPRLPWSGRHGSGLGSTLGHAGIRAFVRPRAWHLRAP